MNTSSKTAQLNRTHGAGNLSLAVGRQDLEAVSLKARFCGQLFLIPPLFMERKFTGTVSLEVFVYNSLPRAL